MGWQYTLSDCIFFFYDGVDTYNSSQLFFGLCAPQYLNFLSLFHGMKKDVSWPGNPTIRTRILLEYGQIREYHVPGNATCLQRVRNRIFPDSNFFRGKENPVSGHLLETRRVKARKLSYSSRFATNNGVPPASTTSQVEHFYFHPVLLCFGPSSTVLQVLRESGIQNSTVRDVLISDISWYVKCHLRFPFRIFHGT